jgi:hypothetical protein
MAAALDAVHRLHRKVTDGYIYTDVCAHCSHMDHGSWAVWPCETVVVVQAALSSDPEPQPTEGPEYHANHAAWKRRQAQRNE